MTNKWLEHVKKVKEENPNLKLKEVLKLAKESYIKDNIQQEKKEVKTLSNLTSGDTKQRGVNVQDDTGLQIERSGSLPVDTQPPADIPIKKLPTNEEKRKQLNEKIFEPTGHTLVKKQDYEEAKKAKSQIGFWKIFSVLCLILLAVFVFLVYDDRFKSSSYLEITPNITAYTNSTAEVTTNINNNYDNNFNPNTTIQNTYYNNLTIINKIYIGNETE